MLFFRVIFYSNSYHTEQQHKSTNKGFYKCHTPILRSFNRKTVEIDKNHINYLPSEKTSKKSLPFGFFNLAEKCQHISRTITLINIY